MIDGCALTLHTISHNLIRVGAITFSTVVFHCIHMPPPSSCSVCHTVTRHPTPTGVVNEQKKGAEFTRVE